MKSPGGSMFPYYYKGGEIHCLKYGSKYHNEDSLFKLMEEEQEFIFNINRKLKIWVDFYKTTITDRVLQEFINHLQRINDRIDKISIVGLTGLNVWRIKRKIRKSGINLIISFYKDPEDAKTWLIHDK